MGKLKLAELRDKLGDGDTAYDVYDEDGRVVGRYVPDEEHRRRMYAEAKAMFTDEEVAEARRDAIASGFDGWTTDELLARILELRRQWEARS